MKNGGAKQAWVCYGMGSVQPGEGSETIWGAASMGWGGKERSILPQAPSPIGRRLSPRGDTPTLLGCPCIDVDWAPSGSQAMALTEEFSRWLLCIKEYFFFNLHFLS